MAPTSTFTSKIKVQLKLSISRLRMVQQKDDAIAKQQRRAMAQLLEQGKYASARIRTENIIRSDLTTELHEILELYCELLLARLPLLEPAACDAGLAEAVKSIIYAAPRSDAKELTAVRALLVEKYGKAFTVEVMEQQEGVAPRVLEKMRVEPPGQELVERYLEAIAEGYGVDYPPGKREEEEQRRRREEEEEEDGDGGEDGNGGGGGGGGGQGVKNLEAPLSAEELSSMTPPRDLGPRSPVSVAPPKPSTENAHPSVKLPGPPDLKPGAKLKKASAGGEGAGKTNGAAKPKVGGSVPDVDDLEKRFALLKR